MCVVTARLFARRATTRVQILGFWTITGTTAIWMSDARVVCERSHNNEMPARALTFADIPARRRPGCLKCVTGWICEAHPTERWPHTVQGRECPGPSMPCDAPGCVVDRLITEGLA